MIETPACFDIEFERIPVSFHRHRNLKIRRYCVRGIGKRVPPIFIRAITVHIREKILAAVAGSERAA